MKKKVIVTSIIGIILMIAGAVLWLFAGNFVQNPTVNLNFNLAIFGKLGEVIPAAFAAIGPATIILIAVCAIMLILWIVQLILIIRKKRGPSVVLLIAFLVEIALTYFALTLFMLPGYASGLQTPQGFGPVEWALGNITLGAGFGVGGVIAYLAGPIVFLIGWIVALIGLISDLIFLASLPKPVKKGAPKNDEVVVIRGGEEESEAVAKDANAVLAEKEKAAVVAQPSAPAAVPAAAGLQGPFLIQYINTYAPEGGRAQQKPGVPVSEIEGAISGEKPLSAEEIRKIIREEMSEKESSPAPVIVTVPAPVEAPKEEPKEKGLTAEDVRAIFSEELDRYLGAEEEEPAEELPEDGDIVVEEEPEEALTADQVREIIAEQIANLQKKPEEPAPEEEKPADVRDIVREELAAYKQAEEEAAKKKEEAERAAQEQQALIDAAREEGAEQARREAEEEAARKAAEEEAAAAAEEPEEELEAMTSDDVRTIIAEEIAKAQPEEKPAQSPEEIAEMIRQIIRSELDAAKPVEEEKVEPAAVVVEPAPEEEKPAQMPVVNIIVKQEAPVAPAPAPEPEPEPEPEAAPAVEEAAPAEKIIRIPFPTRILEADKELKADYNELKSEILSYGVKSRVSNTGDTFRLHKVTFVKITVAGKALKLYFALNPQDYANTTLPIQDAGHKGAYKDIPLVFKVKSDLSLRRAKQLIADVMEKNNLEQGKIEPHNWAADLKDYKPAGADDDDED